MSKLAFDILRSSGNEIDEDDYTKIKDLAKEGRYKIFDFDTKKLIKYTFRDIRKRLFSKV